MPNLFSTLDQVMQQPHNMQPTFLYQVPQRSILISKQTSVKHRTIIPSTNHSRYASTYKSIAAIIPPSTATTPPVIFFSLAPFPAVNVLGVGVDVGGFGDALEKVTVPLVDPVPEPALGTLVPAEADVVVV